MIIKVVVMAIHTCDTQSRTFWYHVVTPILLKTAFEVAMVVFGGVKVLRPAVGGLAIENRYT